MKYNAFILAGSRNGKNDPVAQNANVDYKALVPIDGISMLERVVSTLKNSSLIDQILISAPKDMTLESKVTRIESSTSPSRSVLDMLDVLDNDNPILLTTADHPLLSTQIIKNFTNGYNADQFDVYVAMLPLEILTARYPDMNRTKLRFSNGHFKSCNLFLFKNKTTARRILNFWQDIEKQRKNPWKMIQKLGLITLFRYLSGQLSLQSTLNILGQKTNTNPQAIILDIPEAAIDVDRITDLDFVRQIINKSKN